jgi:hypothetical protein
MKGDFSRDTFDPAKHFLRVLMQQGRVQLDADFNEQVAILLRYMQSLAVDLKGWHWGSGFQVTRRLEDGKSVANDFAVQGGHYYVDGILCESDRAVFYTDQVDYPKPEVDEFQNKKYLVYLDVWEQHITAADDKRLDDGNIPGIREVALGGADTATRSRVVWQVKAVPFNKTGVDATKLKNMTAQEFRDLLIGLMAEVRPGAGKLRARTDPGGLPYTDSPCITPPQARYRGFENQLYRVEIHRAEVAEAAGSASGQAKKRQAAGATASVKESRATFKWSRENASIVFPVRKIAGPVVTVDYLWRDDRLGLTHGDWVELENNATLLGGHPGQLCQVTEIDPTGQRITLDRSPTIDDAPAEHPLLRRWEQKQPRKQDGNASWSDGAILVVESDADEQGWITLENGLQVQFQPGNYRTGDYWLIPARTATGDVEWPLDAGKPKAVEPHGVVHHYAPLTLMSVARGEITIDPADDCRRA